MPRNRPFSGTSLLASGWNPETPRRPSSNPPLTPRTPHSRSGRAEEGFTEIELDEVRRRECDSDEEDYLSPAGHQQTRPLLSASLAPSQGYRSRGDDHEILGPQHGWKYTLAVALERSPVVVGLLLLCFALGTTMMSYKVKSYLNGEPATPPASVSEEDLAHPPASSAPAMQMGSISYENYTTFPLTGSEYGHECGKLMSGLMHHGEYWDVPHMGLMDVSHEDHVDGERVCSSTITYQLDGRVGLTADLALMAQVAAMARERNRTFFVDDTYWNRGKWSDHFQDVRELQPGPEPDCHAPPPEELVACPRLARHWVVNSRTAKYHLGHEFEEGYEDPYARGVNRQQPIYTHALESFTDTIRPNEQNQELINAARAEIASILNLHPASGAEEDTHPAPLRAHADPYISVHIRRGDRLAESWAYHTGYVPLDDYASAARDAWVRLYPELPLPDADDAAHFPAPPVMYVAGDAPEALREYAGRFSSATAIFGLAVSTNADLRALAPQRAYVQAEFAQEEKAERVLLTRGMVVDLALLSGLWFSEGDIVPGAVICTISSNVCKLSALGLGWRRAFGFDDGADYSMGHINERRKRWFEIDNKDVVSPEWRGFEMF